MVELKKERSRTKEVVVFALLKDGKILLEERLAPNKLFSGQVIIPGGMIQKGESREDALFREIMEESQTEPVRYEFLGTFAREEEGLLNRRHLYLVQELNGTIQEKITDDGQRQFFATFDEARTLCKHRSSQEFLDVIESYLVTNEVRPIAD